MINVPLSFGSQWTSGSNKFSLLGFLHYLDTIVCSSLRGINLTDVNQERGIKTRSFCNVLGATPKKWTILHIFSSLPRVTISIDRYFTPPLFFVCMQDISQMGVRQTWSPLKREKVPYVSLPPSRNTPGPVQWLRVVHHSPCERRTWSCYLLMGKMHRVKYLKQIHFPFICLFAPQMLLFLCSFRASGFNISPVSPE